MEASVDKHFERQFYRLVNGVLFSSLTTITSASVFPNLQRYFLANVRARENGRK